MHCKQNLCKVKVIFQRRVTFLCPLWFSDMRGRGAHGQKCLGTRQRHFRCPRHRKSGLCGIPRNRMSGGWGSTQPTTTYCVFGGANNLGQSFLSAPSEGVFLWAVPCWMVGGPARIQEKPISGLFFVHGWDPPSPGLLEFIQTNITILPRTWTQDSMALALIKVWDIGVFLTLR